jgi:hypothetical protein
MTSILQAKNENKITVTLSRNEINALQTYIMLWEHTSKIHKKKLWKVLQVKSMAVWDSAKELAMYTLRFRVRVLISVGSKIPSYYSKARELQSKQKNSKLLQQVTDWSVY